MTYVILALQIVFAIAPYAAAAVIGAYAESKWGAKAASDVKALEARLASLEATAKASIAKL